MPGVFTSHDNQLHLSMFASAGGGGGDYALERTQQENVRENQAAREGIFGIQTEEIRENRREEVFDRLAWDIAKFALQQMSTSIQQWILTGFEGSPAFIQDFEGLLMDAADQAVGDFISESEFGFVCDPFKLDVQIALFTRYQQDKQLEPQRCTLSGSVDNINNFMTGSFSNAGGWFTWHEMTAQPANNPLGSLLDAEGKVAARIANAQNDETVSAIFNAGFKSKEVCAAFDADDNCVQELVETPGRMMHDLLADSFDAPMLGAAMADEINEIMSTLFTQVGTMALQGATGFLGLTDSSSNPYGTGNSYLEDLRREPLGSDSDTYDLDELTADHRDYIALLEEVGDDAISLGERIDTLQDRYPRCPDAQALRLPRVVAEVADRVDPVEVVRLEQILTDIENIEDQLDAATTSQRQQDLQRTLLAIAQSPDLKTDVDIRELEYELAEGDYYDTVDSLEDRIARARAACAADPVNGSYGSSSSDPDLGP